MYVMHALLPMLLACKTPILPTMAIIGLPDPHEPSESHASQKFHAAALRGLTRWRSRALRVTVLTACSAGCALLRALRLRPGRPCVISRPQIKAGSTSAAALGWPRSGAGCVSSSCRLGRRPRDKAPEPCGIACRTASMMRPLHPPSHDAVLVVLPCASCAHARRRGRYFFNSLLLMRACAGEGARCQVCLQAPACLHAVENTYIIINWQVKPPGKPA